MPADATTSPPSQTQVGTARTIPSARDGARIRAVSTAKADFPEALRQLTGLSQPDLGRRRRDVTEDGRVHRLAPGRLLQRRRVELGDPVETMLALGQLAC